ncbi:MAG: type 2 isopentenyl-diphosphate Delta-isomerase [Gordonia sp. (in: high G+C Gram-positive bacteria)]|uniref:type 2 isopentenyl-diphosphate Delta-isomerase n=1 Tax=Gordonia sp. (in: high G+C Gram-positive bacteria) TaxID=84139 RepID=UPI0039E5E642
MTNSRKDDHVRLAEEHQRARPGENEFDDVTFVHHALAAIDVADVSLATSIGEIDWPLPIFINAMTGGTPKTGAINRDLAIAARETGVAMASGSLSAYLSDPATAPSFAVIREENPHGFVLANVNATASVDDARRAVDLLQANALQVHVNSVQEIVMPEGDRAFRSWPAQIERIAAGVDVPVIVKEVGFGMSAETVALLADLGVTAADVAGRGGTNFAAIENSRRAEGDYSYLTSWGQSAPVSLLDAAECGLPLIASGGIRNPLDVARGLALGGVAAGASGPFLTAVVDDGPETVISLVGTWLSHLTALMTVLGARNVCELRRSDLVITGRVREFCESRGIDWRKYSSRSDAP